METGSNIDTTPSSYDHMVDASNEVHTVNWILSVGIFPIIGVFGLIVNLLAVYVLISQTKKNATEVILIGLSTSDFLSAIVVLVFVIPDTMSICSTIIPFEEMPDFFMQDVSFALVMFPLNLSKILTMLIAFERAFAISKPFTFRRIWNLKRSIIFTIIATVVAVVVSFLPVVLPGTYYSYWWLSIIYMFLIFCVTVLCTIVSVYCMLKAKKKLLENGSSTTWSKRLAKEQRITRVLLGMTSLFVVCNILPLVSQVNDMANPDMANSYYDECTDLKWQIVISGGLVLEVLYTVANTFIMIQAKDEYKQTLYGLARKICNCQK